MHGGVNPPIEQWLLWPTPNYIDPVTKPKHVLIVSCFLAPISLALLALRLWVRVSVQKNAGWDDFLMLASLFPLMALTIIFPLVTEVYQFNRHMWDIEFEVFPKQRHFVMSIYALFPLTSGLIKMSVLLFYRRLSSRAVSPAFRWILRITIASIGIYTIIFVFIPIFLCSPISAFWNQQDFKVISRPGGYTYKCSNEGAEIIANGVVSTLQDLIAASLPALLCWNLQMPLRQKIALYGIFAVSYFVVAAGVMRTYTCYKLFFETFDVTWVASDVYLWSVLELHLGAMCANAPALKAFYAHFTKKHQLSQSTKIDDANNTNGSTKPTNWEKFPRWKKAHGRRRDSYINFATDRSIAVERTFQITCDEKHNSTNHGSHPGSVDATSKYGEHNGFDSDIEMGCRQPSFVGSLTESEVQALPPVAIPEPTRGWKSLMRNKKSKDCVNSI